MADFFQGEDLPEPKTIQVSKHFHACPDDFEVLETTTESVRLRMIPHETSGKYMNIMYLSATNLPKGKAANFVIENAAAADADFNVKYTVNKGKDWVELEPTEEGDTVRWSAMPVEGFAYFKIHAPMKFHPIGPGWDKKKEEETEQVVSAME